MMHQTPEKVGTSRLAHARRFVLRCVIGLVAALGVPEAVAAHEIPQHVALRAYLSRDGTTLRVLVRLPLEAMRDLPFPLREDGSLDLRRVQPMLPDAVQSWIIPGLTIRADGVPLAAPTITGARLALPNDRAFESWDSAVAGFQRAPLDSVVIPWQQPLFDVALVYALPAGDATLTLSPTLAQLGIRTTSVLHVRSGDGTERVITYDGNPGIVALNPAPFATAAQFLRHGFTHILGGIDHLLFLLCLVLPVRRWRSLVALITAFTAAHSLTLGAAALGLTPTGLWFPPLIEVLIAASIVWLAIENVLLTSDRLSARWPLAFGFGLVHGFGFSFALRETLQFSGGHLISALAGFNVGVEAGQLLALLPLGAGVLLVHRYAGADRERLVTIVGSVLIAHTSWHWLTERAEVLRKYRASFSWGALDAAFAVGAVRVALIAAVALAVALALRQIRRVPRRS
jgi:hypothetical protein